MVFRRDLCAVTSQAPISCIYIIKVTVSDKIAAVNVKIFLQITFFAKYWI